MNDKVPCSSTKLIRGGTAYSSSPFELKLQLHGHVSNPYSFSIKQNYKSSATTKVSIPPYTEKSWTTPGTYTWTVPAGVTRIRVAVCGGGGGGSYTDSSTKSTADSGGTSYIKSSNSVLIQASGGGGGIVRSNEEGTNQGSGGSAGTPNGTVGKTGSRRIIGDTLGFMLYFIQNSGNYGTGGGCTRSYNSVSSGGSGGYNSNYISVESNKTLTISVGAGGKAYNHYGNTYARNGASGFVLIAYGEGIE